MFHIGQKVVCVDASPCGHTGATELVRGRVYIVRGADSHPLRGVLLEEIIRPNLTYPGTEGEIGFRRSRFRPVKETDISIFTAMLTSLPTLEELKEQQKTERRELETSRAKAEAMLPAGCVLTKEELQDIWQQVDSRRA